jgi:DNA ligase-1
MPISFSDLYHALGETTHLGEKTKLLVNYLRQVPDEEFGWAVYLLQGGACKGAVRTKALRQWVAEFCHLPAWLVEESYGVVGDLAETLALLIAAQRAREPDSNQPKLSIIDWISTIQGLSTRSPDERREYITHMWRDLPARDLIVFNKLLTGGLRIGVSKGMVARALSGIANLPYESVWQRLAGEWQPTQLTREYLTASFDPALSTAPYPFFLAYPLSGEPSECGECFDWQFEWKWDGIRAQLVKRGGVVAIWSRGDELISDSFPELVDAAEVLPDGSVLDGEIVAWAESRPGSFLDLQKRINRKKVTPKLIKQLPVRFLAYDLLESDRNDLRGLALHERRKLLEERYAILLKTTTHISVPDRLQARSWSEISELQKSARQHYAEGLMLKRADSVYGVGRTSRGAWWKWKVAPYSVDAVLLYAQKGHGRRADLFTDYTFGVWQGDTLVTFTKAYSGLTEKELREIDAFIKRNTRERFGPVRTVAPELVFEVAFEALQPSSRHRSGVAVRFPRIVRWRRDKPAAEADTLDALRALASGSSTTGPVGDSDT